MGSYMDAVTEADIVTLMEQSFSAVDELCSQLTADEWDLDTDLPGWTVKDNLAHLAHYESVLTGRPEPEHPTFDASAFPHVKSDFGAANERGVDARRGRSGPEILEEFRDVVAERIKTLASFGEAEWSGEVPSPFGMLPARNFIPIRILDVFYHEQDIRRAANRPGHMGGSVARFTFERFVTLSLPRVIGKDAAAPEGSVVVLDVPPLGRVVTIAVEHGRANPIEEPRPATVGLTFDSLEAFFLLLGGRKTPSRLQEDGRLRVSGDQALAEALLSEMAVVP